MVSQNPFLVELEGKFACDISQKLTPINIGANTSLLIMLGCYLWLFLAAVYTKLPYPLRAASLMLITLAAGIALLFTSAMPSIGLIMVLSTIVLSFLLAGWQTRYWWLLASSLLVVVV